MATVQLTYFRPDGSFHKSVFFKADKDKFQEIIDELKSPSKRYLLVDIDTEGFTVLVRGHNNTEMALLS